MAPSLVVTIALALLPAGGGAAQDGAKPGDKPKDVPVVFRVRVPADTPRTARVYLGGDLEAVGGWRPDGMVLKRIPDGRYAVTVLIPRGARLAYKFTLGSWDRVEKGVKGAELDNRILTVERDDLIDVDAEVVAWAKPGAAPAAEARPAIRSTLTGAVERHAKFRSGALGNERDVLVWLPPGYAQDADRRYPVLYLQDGQNVFDAATSFAGVEWRADETADRLIRAGAIPPILIVAVGNTAARRDEYTPARDEGQKVGGDGPKYGRFLAEELKPFIDRTYRTRPEPEHTAVGGSSLGGLVALEAALEHPDVFGLCAAVSPSIWWANDRVIAEVTGHAEAARRLRIWIDMGTREGDHPDESVERAQKLAKSLRDAGSDIERGHHLEIIEGGEHREADWAARFDRILLYLFAR